MHPASAGGLSFSASPWRGKGAGLKDGGKGGPGVLHESRETELSTHYGAHEDSFASSVSSPYSRGSNSTMDTTRSSTTTTTTSSFCSSSHDDSSLLSVSQARSPLPMPDQSVFDNDGNEDYFSGKRHGPGSVERRKRAAKDRPPSPPLKSPPVSRLFKNKRSLVTPHQRMRGGDVLPRAPMTVSHGAAPYRRDRRPPSMPSFDSRPDQTLTLSIPERPSISLGGASGTGENGTPRSARCIPFDELAPANAGAEDDDAEYIDMGSLGSGSFGTVRRIMRKSDGAFFALKRSLRQFRGVRDREMRLKEARNYALLGQHPHVVSYYQAWEEEGFLYIQTELCERGNLETYMDMHEVGEDEIWNFLVDIALGVAHIHERELVHLDIKPENLFLSADGSLKIGDLGVAVSREAYEDGGEGDSRYLAPELLDGVVGPKADIFSIGCTIFELATRVELPTGGTLWHRLRSGDVIFPDTPKISDDLERLIRTMMSPSPSQRPTAQEILDEPCVRALLNKRRASSLGKRVVGAATAFRRSASAMWDNVRKYTPTLGRALSFDASFSSATDSPAADHSIGADVSPIREDDADDDSLLRDELMDDELSDDLGVGKDDSGFAPKNLFGEFEPEAAAGADAHQMPAKRLMMDDEDDEDDLIVHGRRNLSRRSHAPSDDDSDDVVIHGRPSGAARRGLARRVADEAANDSFGSLGGGAAAIRRPMLKPRIRMRPERSESMSDLLGKMGDDDGAAAGGSSNPRLPSTGSSLGPNRAAIDRSETVSPIVWAMSALDLLVLFLVLFGPILFSSTAFASLLLNGLSLLVARETTSSKTSSQREQSLANMPPLPVRYLIFAGLCMRALIG